MSYKILIVGGLIVAAGTASAQLTNVGPFTGVYSEGFESFPNYTTTGIYDSLAIMGGEATFSSSPSGSNQLVIYSPSNGADWGVLLATAAVESGVNGLGIENIENGEQSVDATLTFTKSVSQFGGYFTSDQLFSTLLTFRDNSNAVIGTELIQPAGAGISITSGSFPVVPLTWYGWSSTDAIKSITFTGSMDPAMDDLQAGANATPEPGAYAVLGLGTLGLLLRRKKR